MRLDPPSFLKCLELMGKRYIPTLIEVSMAMRAMRIIIQFKRKVNFLPEAICLLSSALVSMESSISSMPLGICIENEELIETLKVDWSNFCVEFVDHLCFASKIPFSIPVAIQVVSNTASLIRSGSKASIAVLWGRIPGTRRVLESVADISRVANLENLRKACMASVLPAPLLKAYVMLTDLSIAK